MLETVRCASHPVPALTPSEVMSSLALPMRPRKGRVLVVDDEPANVGLLRQVLEAEGYSVSEARDGRLALELALAEPPDLVLLDVSLPSLSGLDVCRGLKADPRTQLVPVVLVTGAGARETRLSGLAAGCDDFLTKPLDLDQLVARTRNALRMKSLVDQLEQAENVLVSLANAIDANDHYTRGHSDRVSEIAAALGRAAGLSPAECSHMHRAGLLHDIGKIGVPLEYIHKPARLTSEEYRVVKSHSAIGYEICRPLKTMAPLLPLIRGHHERLDGHGYPDGLEGNEVSLSLRCLTIADIYDALTSDRPYRPALSQPTALQIMREEASMGMWDRDLIELVPAVVQEAAP